MTHESGCECGAYACELRAKSIHISANASPVSRARRPFRPKVNASWEAGLAGERRKDGSFMPYMDKTGRRIHVKEAGERRQELSEIRRQQITGPALKE